MEETKNERFKRVAGKRVKRIIDELRTLSNCSNLNNYEYSEEEVNKMIKALRDELKLVEILFKKKFSQNDNKFNF